MYQPPRVPAPDFTAVTVAPIEPEYELGQPWPDSGERLTEPMALVPAGRAADSEKLHEPDCETGSALVRLGWSVAMTTRSVPVPVLPVPRLTALPLNCV